MISLFYTQGPVSRGLLVFYALLGRRASPLPLQRISGRSRSMQEFFLLDKEVSMMDFYLLGLSENMAM